MILTFSRKISRIMHFLFCFYEAMHMACINFYEKIYILTIYQTPSGSMPDRPQTYILVNISVVDINLEIY